VEEVGPGHRPVRGVGAHRRRSRRVRERSREQADEPLGGGADDGRGHGGRDPDRPGEAERVPDALTESDDEEQRPGRDRDQYGEDGGSSRVPQDLPHRRNIAASRPMHGQGVGRDDP
jgi:hypothetical protein